jgi:hypothetical protein
MPTNFCRANVVNVFLKKENAAKGNLAANAHWSKFNAVLAFHTDSISFVLLELIIA